MKKFIYILMLFALTAAVWAQPDPNNPQPDGEVNRPNLQNRMLQGAIQAMMNGQATTVKTTDGAFFVLRNGVLGKFDLLTLKPLGQCELYGPLPEQPKQNAAEADVQTYLTELTKRLSPATVIAHGANLVIATNDYFFYIDGATLQPKINVQLAAQNPAAPAAGGFRLGGLATGPILEVKDNIAYMVRGDSMAAFDLDAGKVLADEKIPETMNINLQQITNLLRPNQPNNNRPNRPNNQPGQNQNPQNAADAAKVVVGVIRHVTNQTDLWTIEARDGSKYVLLGNKAKELAAKPNIDGMNVRVKGAFTANAFGGIQYGDGTIMVTSYEVIQQ